MRRIYFNLILLVLFGYPLLADIQNKTLSFKENKGQWPEKVFFKGDIGSHSIWIENQRISYQLVNENLHPLAQLHKERHKESPDTSKYLAHVFRLNFLNSLPSTPKPFSTPESTLYNYYLSSNQKEWASGVKAFSSVIYEKLYKGVDLKIYGGNSFLKYDLELDEGVNGKEISFQYEGLNGIELSGGKLRLKTALGTIEEHIPKAYQLIDGQAIEVACRFTLKGNMVGFAFEKPLNPRYKTVIDPVLVFFTYSGSLSDNWANSAVSDKDGNSYTAGTIYGNSFPTITGAFDRTYNGGNLDPYLGYDIGILKFNPTGNQLLSGTYLGGSRAETPHSLTIDNDQNLVVMGTTSSSNFPVTQTAYQRVFKGGVAEFPYGSSSNFILPSYAAGSDIFIFKLRSNGQSMLASTFLGGSGTDGLLTINQTLVTNYGDQFRGDVIVGPDNSIYVASHSRSNDFPTVQASQSSLNGAWDGVVCKLNSNLSQLLWSTYFGGPGEDAFYSIQLLGNDKLAVCGGTTSPNLPGTQGSYQPAKLGNSIDAQVAVYNRNNGQLIRSTFSSTAQYDQAYIVQTDPAQNIYIFGQTQGSMPKNSNTYGQANGGQFLQKFNADLSQMIWGTTFGSQNFTPNISPTAMMIDSCNRIFMAGWGGRVNYFGQGFAGGFTKGLPISSDALQPISQDSSDFYFIVLGADAKNLVYGTYFGSNSGRGEHVDGGTSRFDRNGTITQAVCGCRDDFDNFFKGTPGSYRPSIGSGNCNNGVMKINLFELEVNFNFSGQLLCPATLTLFNNSQNGENYTWFFGNGDSLQSNNSSISYQYQVPGKYQIILKAVNPKTCRYERFAMDSINIPNPFPFVGISKEDRYCVGDSLFPVFSDLINYSIQWSPTIYVDDPTSYKPTITPLSSVNYKVLAKDSNGCVSESSFKIKNRKIDLGFGYEKTFKPCEGTYTVRYFSNRDSSDFYKWYFGDKDSATGPEVIKTYTSNGRFPVRLNGRKANCEENAIDTLNLFDQKTFVLPDFSTLNLFKSCDNPAIKFINKSINGQAFYWDFGDGYKSTDIEPEHIFEKPGTYKVILYAFHTGCRTEIVREIEVEKFEIPNLILTNDDGINETFMIKGLQIGWTLEIFNRWGKSVYKSNDYKNDWKAENLQEGTYFYNITFPEGEHCNGWIQAMKP